MVSKIHPIANARTTLPSSIVATTFATRLAGWFWPALTKIFASSATKKVREADRKASVYETRVRYETTDCNLSLDILTLDALQIPSWRSSRDIARSLFSLLGITFDVTKFCGPGFRPEKHRRHDKVSSEPLEMDNDDMMDIDDDEQAQQDIPSHPLDRLHIGIIDVFKIKIYILVERVRKEHGEHKQLALSASRYAPTHQRKPFDKWTLSDCLDYLDAKKKLVTTRPPLKVFMLKRSEDSGWRRGQDWSRQDWTNALSALEDIGNKYQDGSILDDLSSAKLIADEVFRTPMRPTGI